MKPTQEDLNWEVYKESLLNYNKEYPLELPFKSKKTKRCRTKNCKNKVKQFETYCSECIIKDDGYVEEWIRKVKHDRRYKKGRRSWKK